MIFFQNPFEGKIGDIFTLMYRTYGREFEHIGQFYVNETLDVNKNVFPNTNYGLNGRTLVASTLRVIHFLLPVYGLLVVAYAFIAVCRFLVITNGFHVAVCSFLVAVCVFPFYVVFFCTCFSRCCECFCCCLWFRVGFLCVVACGFLVVGLFIFLLLCVDLL